MTLLHLIIFAGGALCGMIVMGFLVGSHREIPDDHPDTERLDFIAKGQMCLDCDPGRKLWAVTAGFPRSVIAMAPTLRQVIDRAMRPKP